MKVNTILAIEWTTLVVEKEHEKNSYLTGIRALIFAMTGSYCLSIKLIKPMGEQAIVSL